MASQTGVIYDVPTALHTNTFSREGHRFIGWATSSTGDVMYSEGAAVTSLVASGSTTLYARWAPNSYNVSFDLDGGTGISAPVQVEYGDKVPDPGKPTKAGYTFATWCKDAARTIPWDFAVDVAGVATTLYAKWDANTYSVHFDGNGGAADPVMIDQVFTYDAPKAALLRNTNTKEGYLFSGWSKTQGGGVDFADGAEVFNLAYSGVVTLYAVWSPITYTVRFHAGSGEGSMPDQGGFVYDVSATLSSNGFTKVGHSFAGWATAEGGPAVYADGAEVRGLSASQGGIAELWATWSPNTYPVSFQSNGGSAVTASTGVYGNTISAPESPTRAGYAFIGWYRNQSLTVPWDFASDTIAGETVLWAKWTVMADVDVPIDPKLSIDAQGAVTADLKSFVSRSPVKVLVAGVSCQTTATTKSIFPDETQWPGIRVTLAEPGKPYDGTSVRLGKTASSYFEIPAAPDGGTSSLEFSFGLELPAGAAISYTDAPDGVPVALLTYTFDLLA